MTEKGTPFMLIGTTICWIKETITVIFEKGEVEEDERMW